MPKVLECTDNVERLKILSGAFVGSLHVGQDIFQSLSPLNPILGETC